MSLCRYCARPYLINGVKFDLRLYVLVTSINPLVIYLYDEGLVRLCTKKFVAPASCRKLLVPRVVLDAGNAAATRRVLVFCLSLVLCLHLPATNRYTITKKNLKDLFVHLTNYSINKDSADFQANVGDGDEASGHKWSFAALKRHWTEQGVDVARVMAAVRHLVAKTFVAVESEVWGRCYEMMGSRASAFELFGFDLMFEEDLTPRLVEVGSLQPWSGCACSKYSLVLFIVDVLAVFGVLLG